MGDLVSSVIAAGTVLGAIVIVGIGTTWPAWLFGVLRGRGGQVHLTVVTVAPLRRWMTFTVTTIFAWALVLLALPQHSTQHPRWWAAAVAFVVWGCSLFIAEQMGEARGHRTWMTKQQWAYPGPGYVDPYRPY